VEKMPLQCVRMAAVATEYCTFIDGFDAPGNRSVDGSGRDANWMMTLVKLFPRLHVAVIALIEPTETVHSYRLYDDDQRCELFLRLNTVLQADKALWAMYEGDGVNHAVVKQQSRQELCERMADNLTDMYFDLQRGLDLVSQDPLLAVSNWQCSFYAHWGKHLLDAECWLHAIGAGGEPPRLPEWQWPNQPELVVNLA